MSIIRCERCDRMIDTDAEETHYVVMGPEDREEVCETCYGKHREKVDAEMKAAHAEYLTAKAAYADRQDIIDAGRGHLLKETWEK